MYSVWWVLSAFVLGGYAGILLFSLMTMGARDVDTIEGGEQVET